MTTTPAAPNKRAHSHYFRDITHLSEIDVYRICELFVDDPSGATQHAVRKLLLPGQRGAKDRRKDLQEAMDTIARRIQMLEEDEHKGNVFMASMDQGAGDDTTVIAVFDEKGLVSTETAASLMTAKNPVGQPEIKEVYGAMQDAMTATPLTATPTSDIDPHAELRKAWAPGQLWQFRENYLADWRDVAGNPVWNPHIEYRRKPEGIADSESPAAEKPWYPDDSGLWVEVPHDTQDIPKELSADQRIEYLVKCERDMGRYMPVKAGVRRVLWDHERGANNRIVAYKIVS